MNGEAAAVSRLGAIQGRALLVGSVAGILCILGAVFDTRQFLISYLFGYLFWLGLAFGCMLLLMIHHLSGGRWGFPLRRFFEAAAMTVPLMALLFVPILFGLRTLYPWAQPDVVAASEILQHKRLYMNEPAFIVRTVVFFAACIWLALTLNKWSFLQDTTADPEPTRRLRTLSGPALALFPFLATFVYVDWMLSLEADWYSTMFVVLILVGQILTALAFSTCLLAALREDAPYEAVLTTANFHHLGSLLLAFVMMWAYMSFSQFLIIWAGNLPHEINWYLHRIAGGWKGFVIALAAFHFFLPFILLLSKKTKTHVTALVSVAALVFFAHMGDVYWMVVPSFYTHGIRIHWLDAAAPLAVGGIWMTAFCARLKSHPLLVRNDPRQPPPP